MFSKVNDFVEAKKSNFSIYFDWNSILLQYYSTNNDNRN